MEGREHENPEGRRGRRARGTTGSTQVVVASAAVVVVLLVGVLVWQRPWEGGPPVALVGDSIFAMSKSALSDKLRSDWDVRTEATPGITTVGQVGPAEQLATRRPAADQLVVELGTNDLVQGVPSGDSQAALDQIIAAYPQASCVHLVTVTERKRSGADAPVWTEAVAYNQALKARAGVDPRVRVVDWAAAVDAQDGPEGNPLLVDAVHPDADGRGVLAGLVHDSVQSCRS